MKTDINTLALSLKKDVLELCQPEGRMVGSTGHLKAEEWVSRRLSEIGCLPYAEKSFAIPYTSNERHFTNFVGCITGEDRTLPPVLIGAHYDSFIPHPCADDNGAAVAIALAAAQAVAIAGGLKRDLVVAIFDAEEPPYFNTPSMGSIRFYEDQVDQRGIHFALISDLVGHDVTLPRETFRDLPNEVTQRLAPLTFVTGAESHSDLPNLLQSLETPTGMNLIATLNEYVGDMSDHGIFRKNGVPYLFLSCGHWEHYHQPSDTPDRLNYEKMANIALFSEQVCKTAASESFPTDLERHDPFKFESSTWTKALGPLCESFTNILGVPDLNSRSNITKAVSCLQSLGL